MSSLRSTALELGLLLQTNKIDYLSMTACENHHPDVEKALSYIKEYLEGNGKWKLNVDSNKYLRRIQVLIMSPYIINQSSFGLCVNVSFLITLIYHNPMAFAEFSVQLLRDGKGCIGSKLIMPDLEFRNYDFGKIFQNLNKKNNRTYPEADLIIQGAIQDYDNQYLDFDFTEGYLADESEGSQSFIKLPEWFNQTKLFKTAKYVDIDLAKVSQQFETVIKENKYVILRHYSNGNVKNIINKNSDSGRHACIISPNIPTEVKDDKLCFTVLSWGEAIDIEITGTKFSEAVMGYILVK
jgi:hypothetical protein